jgi:hypothetical protein
MELFAFVDHTLLAKIAVVLLGGIVTLSTIPFLAEISSLCSGRVGIVEQLWSLHRNLREGRMMALPGQTGYQTAVLRASISFLLGRWVCRALMLGLAEVRQGKTRPGYDTGLTTYLPARSRLPARRAFRSRPWVFLLPNQLHWSLCFWKKSRRQGAPRPGSVGAWT